MTTNVKNAEQDFVTDFLPDLSKKCWDMNRDSLFFTVIINTLVLKFIATNCIVSFANSTRTWRNW